MHLTFTLNVAGLTLNFMGTLLMFIAKPKVDVNAGQLPNEETLKELAAEKRNTKVFRFGMLVLSIGFLFQLISLVIFTT